MYGISTWVAKSTLLPLNTAFINNKSLCIVILPINNNLEKSKYIEIKELQHKMLLVLGRSIRSLNIVNLFCHGWDSQIFSLDQQDHITKKILLYYKYTKLILQFGDLEFLNINFLNEKEITITKVLHPLYLLQHPDHKKQAYKDLLLCKNKLEKLL